MNRQARAIIRKQIPKILPKDIVKKWHLYTNDTVMVMEGKDTGHIGKITRVFRDRNELIVEGANICRKHIPSDKPGVGYVLDREYPIPLSSVKLYLKEKELPTDIEWVKRPSGTGLMRKSVQTGLIIPCPPRSMEGIEERPAGKQDTLAQIVSKFTWTPKINDPPIPKDCIP